MFVEEGRSEREIAMALNQQGVLSDFGHLWTRASIHQILTTKNTSATTSSIAFLTN
jgi:hypothetical protein